MSATKTDAGDIALGILIAAGFVLLMRAWGKCQVDETEPCAVVVHATVHGKAPDGTPAEIASTWCGKYKPGREPKP